MASSAILHSPSTFSSLTSSFFSQRLPSYPPQQKRTSKMFAIRAGRTESKGVSLGSRPPQFQKGLAVVAISSNSVATHPQDGPDFMAEDARQFSYPFPYLYDESQDVAREFGAVCTPEFFLFKKDGRRPFQLVYHGQFDDSRPSNNVPVTGRDLAVAVDCVLSAQPVPSVQKPSVGCSIKWHPVTEV